MELLTPVTGTRSDPVAAAEKKAASRQTGRLWVEVIDTECARCERLFKVMNPEELLCRRCRREEGN